MTIPVISEEKIATLVTAKTRDMVQELVQTLMPNILTKLVREEVARIKAEAIRNEKEGQELCSSDEKNRSTDPSAQIELPLEFERMLQETFAPQIVTITRKLAQEHVTQTLPNVAERLVLAEIHKCVHLKQNI